MTDLNAYVEDTCQLDSLLSFYLIIPETKHILVKCDFQTSTQTLKNKEIPAYEHLLTVP